MTKPLLLDESHDFSLVLGGPLFQLYRKAHLTGDALELLRRRIALFVLITWLPLLLAVVPLEYILDRLIRFVF